MGFLRLWLAIAVVLEHTSPWKGILGLPLNGNIAVSAFYVISGFYIQLLISEKYVGQPNWIRNFYASRALRIFPLYYIFLIISLPMAFQINEVLIKTIATGNIGTIFFVLFENVFIFGQDIGRFLTVDLPSGELKTHFFPIPDPTPASSLPIIGQAWSLAVEFGFYLLAPLLLTRKTLAVVAIALCAVMVRLAVAHALGDGHYSRWWNQFLPSEIATFLLGSLGYRYYSKYLANVTPVKPAVIFIAAIFFYSIAYRSLENHWEAGVYAVFLLLIALAVPYLFAATRRNRLDRFVGELSYPVYLGHIFLINYALSHGFVPVKWFALAILVGVILLSIPLVKFIEEPIAKFRERRFAPRTALAR